MRNKKLLLFIHTKAPVLLTYSKNYILSKPYHILSEFWTQFLIAKRNSMSWFTYFANFFYLIIIFISKY